jgi:hypothetical protein
MAYTPDDTNVGILGFLKASAAKPATVSLKYPTSQFNGKYILWCGTSIPLGDFYKTYLPSTATVTQYPNDACAQHGASCYNEAVSSSMIMAAPSNGAGMFWSSYAWALTHTTVEKQYIIDNWATISTGLTGSTKPTTLSASDQATILGASYQSRIIPYVDGTGGTAASLVVIDHGVNDYSNWNAAGYSDANFIATPSNIYDKTTFIGACGFLINEILKVNPTVRIAFSGHFENLYQPYVAQAQTNVATLWNLPIFKLWEKTGWSYTIKMPNTQALYSTLPYSLYTSTAPIPDTTTDMPILRYNCADGVHPFKNGTDIPMQLLAELEGYYLTTI